MTLLRSDEALASQLTWFYGSSESQEAILCFCGPSICIPFSGKCTSVFLGELPCPFTCGPGALVPAPEAQFLAFSHNLRDTLNPSNTVFIFLEVCQSSGYGA